MVIISPLRIGLWDPLQMAFLWLINGCDPNQLLTGMILQVVFFHRVWLFFWGEKLGVKNCWGTARKIGLFVWFFLEDEICEICFGKVDGSSWIYHDDLSNIYQPILSISIMKSSILSYCRWFTNPANQLRLVVCPIIYNIPKIFAHTKIKDILSYFMFQNGCKWVGWVGLSVVPSDFFWWLFFYEQFCCLQNNAPTNSMSSAVILLPHQVIIVLLCCFHPRDAEKSTRHDFQNDTICSFEVECVLNKILRFFNMNPEYIFFPPKTMSKL